VDDSATAMDTAQLKEIEERIGYRFKNAQLLVTALTHSSFANEINGTAENNERLEFLGDAVLELAVSEELFARFPQDREGSLTSLRAQLVSEPSLADLARTIELQQCLRLGKGEESQGGRERNAVLCDALESVLGAVFVDGGYQEAKGVIGRLFEDLWPERIQGPKGKDFKSRLQEETQKLFKDRPVYTLKQSSGPEHAKTYHILLTLPDGQGFEASASSVKKAEQKAAQKALHSLAP